MPTYYCKPTTPSARKLVELKNKSDIDAYIDGTHEWCASDQTSGPYKGQKVNTLDRKDRIYHIAIVAVQTQSLEVLEHIRDSIDPDYHMCDGNTYSAFHLSAKKLAKHQTKQWWQIYKFLFKLLPQDYTEKHFYTRYFVRPEFNLNLDLIDAVIKLTDCDIWDIYHYSIAWNQPQITEHVLIYHKHLVKPEWTKRALEVARTFNSEDSIKMFEQKKWMYK